MKNPPATWNELHQFVHIALCEKENLIPEQFPLEVVPLQRNNRFCGVEFSLYGPRQIRLGGVWSADSNTLYLFDARGVRFHTAKLPQPVKQLPSAIAG